MGTTGRKQGRGDLSDAQWRLIGPLLPKQRRGGKWNDHRLTLDGILWVLRTGAPWRDLPERYGKWQSVYDRFNRYRKDGTFDRVLKALRIRLDLDLPHLAAEHGNLGDAGCRQEPGAEHAVDERALLHRAVRLLRDADDQDGAG